MEMEVWEWWGGVKQGCKPSLWGSAGWGVGKDRVGRRGSLGWGRGTTMCSGREVVVLWG